MTRQLRETLLAQWIQEASYRETDFDIDEGKRVARLDENRRHALGTISTRVRRDGLRYAWLTR